MCDYVHELNLVRIPGAFRVEAALHVGLRETTADASAAPSRPPAAAGARAPRSRP
jgi:hypothetical protein